MSGRVRVSEPPGRATAHAGRLGARALTGRGLPAGDSATSPLVRARQVRGVGPAPPRPPLVSGVTAFRAPADGDERGRELGCAGRPRKGTARLGAPRSGELARRAANFPAPPRKGQLWRGAIRGATGARLWVLTFPGSPGDGDDNSPARRGQPMPRRAAAASPPTGGDATHGSARPPKRGHPRRPNLRNPPRSDV